MNDEKGYTAIVGRRFAQAFHEYKPNLIVSVHPLMQHVPVRWPVCCFTNALCWQIFLTRDVSCSSSKSSAAWKPYLLSPLRAYPSQLLLPILHAVIGHGFTRYATPSRSESALLRNKLNHLSIAASGSMLRRYPASCSTSHEVWVDFKSNILPRFADQACLQFAIEAQERNPPAARDGFSCVYGDAYRRRGGNGKTWRNSEGSRSDVRLCSSIAAFRYKFVWDIPKRTWFRSLTLSSGFDLLIKSSLYVDEIKNWQTHFHPGHGHCGLLWR